MSLIVRKAVSSDLESLIKLNQALHAEHLKERPDFFNPLEDSFLAKFFEEKISDEHSYVFIAEIEREVAGYIYAEKRERKESAFFKAHTSIYISHIFVELVFRRKGVAKDLIERIKKLAKELGVNGVALEVWDFNEAAKNCFANNGFKPNTLSLHFNY